MQSKKTIPYIFGFIGLVATAFMVVLLNQWTGWEVQSLSILFIIPIGAILLGMGGAGGFFFGRKLTNTKMSKIDYIIAIIFGLSTFLLINYISYRNTYITVGLNDEIDIQYQFTQPKEYISISKLIKFGEYINMVTSSSSHQLRYKGFMKIGDEFEVGKTPTTILFYVKILGASLGGLATALFLVGSEYCEKCKKYYKYKVLKTFDLENFDEYAKDINKNIENGILLKEAIDAFKNDIPENKQYGQIELTYCPDCYNGYLLFKFFIKNPQGEPKEIIEMRQTILLGSKVTMEISKTNIKK